MNRTFKVIFSKVLGKHVVVSELARSCTKKGTKAIAAAALAVSCFNLPAYADYPVDAVSEDDFKSALSVNYLNFSKGMNSKTGKLTLGIDNQTASQLKTVTVGINATSGFLPNSKLVLVQGSIATDSPDYNTYTGRFTAGGTEWTVTAKYENGKWTTSILDPEGNKPSQMKIQTGPYESSSLQMTVAEVNKKTNGYFMTNTIKTTGQVTGKESKQEATVQIGDVVTATVNKNGTNHANDDSLTIKVNGEEVAKYTGVHYYSVNDGGSQQSNYNNTGATGLDSLAAGVGASATGIISSVTGAYSSVSGGTLQNLGGVGATVYGAVNTVEVSGQFDGVANSVIGIANSTSNANGALIWGAGNSITNALGTVTDSQAIMAAYGKYKLQPTAKNLKALQTVLADAVAESGGNVMAVGGANKAGTEGKVSYSQLMGVSNELKSGNFNFLDGYKNTVEGDNNIAIGTENTVTGDKSIAIGYGHQVKGKGNAVIGDPNTVTGDDNQVLANESTVTGNSNVAIGNGVTVEADDGVAVGSGSQVSVDGGVALGKGSVASTDAGEVGYDPSTGAASTDTSAAWKSTAAAVSVGDAGSDITRQITGVAAGTKDTDAVNVAQLKLAGSSIEFNGDTGATISKPKQLNVIGGITDESRLTTEDNIGVVSDGKDSLKVRLAKDIKGVDTVTVNKSVTVGDVTMTKDGFKVKNGPSMTKSGISAGGKKITNVAAGTAPTDAVNVSQLNDATQQHEKDFRRLMHKDAQLERKIHRTGAHAAALAALHPLDFDEDHKWTASAGVGAYHGSNAVAAGVFYRPDENKMFSLGVSLNESDSMVNAGFSYRFGSGSENKTSPNSYGEMKRQVSTLSEENRSLSAELSSTSERLASADREIASLKGEIAQIKKMLMKGGKRK